MPAPQMVDLDQHQWYSGSMRLPSPVLGKCLLEPLVQRSLACQKDLPGQGD